MKDKIREFIALVQKSYPINLTYEYDSKEEFYYVWYGGSEALVSEDKFMETMSIFMDEIFWENDIYNISLGYNSNLWIKSQIELGYVVGASMNIKTTNNDNYICSNSAYVIKNDLNLQYDGQDVVIPTSNYSYNHIDEYYFSEGAFAA